MFKLRKFLILCLLVCVNFSFGKSNAMKGDQSVEERGFYEYEYSAEELDSIKKKEDEILSAKRNRSYIDGGQVKTLNVKYFQQETNYYCGPATVKQVLHYVNGKSSSQKYYASRLGTTTNGTNIGSMTKVLTSSVKFNYDYYSFNKSKYKSDSVRFSSWMDKVRFGIDRGRPTVLDINTNSVKSWPYKSSGHYVNTSGYDTKTMRIRITDPFKPGLGNKWYKTRDVYKSNMDHWDKAIIW